MSRSDRDTPPATEPLRLLTVKEAAQLLGVTDDVVTALLDARELAEHRLPGRMDVPGRRRYTSRAAIESWLRRQIDRAYAPVELPPARPRRVK